VRIAEQNIEEWRPPHRPEVRKPYGQRDGKDHRRIPAETRGRFGGERRSRPRTSPAGTSSLSHG